MAIEKPAKKRVASGAGGIAGGRVTPKGSHHSNNSSQYVSLADSSQHKKSPVWVSVMLFFWLGLGIATIIVNYLGMVWDTSNIVLLVGLLFILFGLVTATKLH